MSSLVNFPPMTGLDRGRSTFWLYRNISASNSVGSFSRFDILRLDFIFFSDRFLGLFTGSTGGAEARWISVEGIFSGRPRGRF